MGVVAAERFLEAGRECGDRDCGRDGGVAKSGSAGLENRAIDAWGFRWPNGEESWSKCGMYASLIHGKGNSRDVGPMDLRTEVASAIFDRYGDHDFSRYCLDGVADY